MLLDREAANGATLEIGSGRVGAKQLALDVDGEIANPAGHSDEVLMMAVGPVPYSSRSRRRRSSSTTARTTNPMQSKPPAQYRVRALRSCMLMEN